MAMAALTPAPVSSRRGSIHRASFGPAVGNEGNDDDEVIVHLPLNEEALAIEPSTLKPWSLNEGKEKGGKERARAKVKAVRELTRASIGSLLGEENEPEPEPEPVKVDKPVRASRKRNVAA